MVYSEHFVAVVVCNGQITREIRELGEDKVYLPFGSDYSIRLKNMHSTRAVVSIEIDGKDVMNGNQLVVEPNSDTELKGFMDGNTARQAFRFIEKTKEISEHRGDKIEDGFIRISWKYEKQKPIVVKKITEWQYEPHPYNPHRPYWYDSTDLKSSSVLRSRRIKGFCGNDECDNAGETLSDESLSYNSGIGGSCCNSSMPLSKNGNYNYSEDKAGITVAGKDINQSFYNVAVGELEEQEHVIVIHLMGKESSGKVISKPVLAQRTIQCSSCGRFSKSNIKFCPNCGTRLLG